MYTFETVGTAEQELEHHQAQLAEVRERRLVAPNSVRLVRLMFAHKRAIRQLEMGQTADNLGLVTR